MKATHTAEAAGGFGVSKVLNALGPIQKLHVTTRLLSAAVKPLSAAVS